jgi:hypothetical protein
MLWLQLFLFRLACGERYQKPTQRDWRAGGAEIFVFGLTIWWLSNFKTDLPYSTLWLWVTACGFMGLAVSFVLLVTKLPNVVAIILATMGSAFLSVSLLEAFDVL